MQYIVFTKRTLNWYYIAQCIVPPRCSARCTCREYCVLSAMLSALTLHSALAQCHYSVHTQRVSEVRCEPILHTGRAKYYAGARGTHVQRTLRAHFTPEMQSCAKTLLQRAIFAHSSAFLAQNIACVAHCYAEKIAGQQFLRTAMCQSCHSLCEYRETDSWTATVAGALPCKTSGGERSGS